MVVVAVEELAETEGARFRGSNTKSGTNSCSEEGGGIETSLIAIRE